MIRLFVAISLPRPVRDRLAMLCGGVPGARWVQPENMHLTLRFIGEVAHDVAEDVDAALAAVRMPPFDIALSGVGAFGSTHKARLLWAGVDKSEPLARLHDKVDHAVVQAGLAPDDRKFSPHVTLARLKGAKRLAGYLEANAAYRSETIRVEGFTLYSSFLGSSGAIYTPEAEYPLEPS